MSTMHNRFLRALNLEPCDRPPFVPAVYEHKAWFIGKTPSEICRDGTLLLQAVTAEYEALRADAIVVGVDVYNVEAEACGCPVTYFEDASIPSLAPGSGIIKDGVSVSGLQTPDPCSTGRMPLMIEATAKARNAIDPECEVMGAVTAPFSLAASLMGASNLFMAMAAEPETAHEAIAFAADVVVAYGMAFAARGLHAALFDSQASPGLISPRAYREFVLGPTQRVVSELRRGGMNYVPLVIGGNTDPIVGSYVDTGANYVLCDGGSSVSAFLPVCRAARRAFRRNIPASYLMEASLRAIEETAGAESDSAEGFAGFILGTGIVPYGIPTEKILAARAGLYDTRVKQ